MTTNKKDSLEEAADFKRLGRVTSLGPKASWQAALLLPTEFQDLRHPLRAFADCTPGVSALFALRVVRPPDTRFGPPRVVLSLEDTAGRIVRGIIFGDQREHMGQFVVGAELSVMAKYKADPEGGGILSIEGLVGAEWIGRVRPIYPGKTNSIGPDLVRERVLSLLPFAAPTAARYVEEEIRRFAPVDQLLAALGVPGWRVEDIFWQAHTPVSIEHGHRAQLTLERIAGLVALRRASENQPRHQVARQLALTTVDARIAQYAVASGTARGITFEFTDEQLAACHGVATALSGQLPARCLISADTGIGKSPVYQCVVAAAVDAGARVLVLLPNLPLADQAAREIRLAFPDLDPCFVSGETDARLDLSTKRLLIGTTALLHRNAGAIDVVVVDEQQKFAVAQREAYVAADTHLIEVSATCLPRTLALARYGALDVFQLRKQHADKRIVTRVVTQSAKRALLDGIKATVANGDQVFLIYPAREASEEGEGMASEDTTSRRNVATAAALWEPFFPGRVLALTGAASDEEKTEVLGQLRDNKASVLVTTSLVEIGITAPRVMRVVVFEADRFGLTTIHQIRGRVARHGGEGFCDLFVQEPIGETARQRLEILCTTTDGFAIAEADMRLRGVGNLAPASTKQSGADDTFLYQRPLSLSRLEEIHDLHSALTKWGENTKKRA
jgi:ATP-dependent DNA helicase RecG